MKQKLLAILILVFAMCSIQTGASVAKQLFPLAGIAGAASLRLIFASIILSLIFKPWKISYTRSNLKSLFLYGSSLGIMNLAFYFSLERIPLGIAVALEFTGPLAVAIFSSKKKIDYIWAILAGIGIYLLLPLKDSPEALDPIGILFALLAGLFWAFYIIYGKKAGGGVSGGVATAMGMTFAALVVTPWGIVIDTAQIFSIEALPLGLFVGIFGSALPYTLEMMALKKMSKETFSILMSLEPAVACLSGLILLSEFLSPTQWLAIALVIISSLGSSLSSQKS